jgi:hypothetical protein
MRRKLSNNAMQSDGRYAAAADRQTFDGPQGRG